MVFSIFDQFRLAEFGFTQLATSRIGLQVKNKAINERFVLVDDPDRAISEVKTATRFVVLLETHTKEIFSKINIDRARKVFCVFSTFLETSQGMPSTDLVDLSNRVCRLFEPFLNHLNNQIDKILQKVPKEITSAEADLLHEKLVALALNRELIECVSYLGKIKSNKSEAVLKAQSLGLLCMGDAEVKEVVDVELEENVDLLTAQEQAFMHAASEIGQKLVTRKIAPQDARYGDFLRQMKEYLVGRPERTKIVERILCHLEVYEWIRIDADSDKIRSWLCTFKAMIATQGEGDSAWLRFCGFKGKGVKFLTCFSIYTTACTCHRVSAEYQNTLKLLAFISKKIQEEEVGSIDLEAFQKMMAEQISHAQEIEEAFFTTMDRLFKGFQEIEHFVIDEYLRIEKSLGAFRSQQRKPKNFLYLANFPSHIRSVHDSKVLPKAYTPIVLKNVLAKAGALRMELLTTCRESPLVQPEVKALSESFAKLKISEELKEKDAQAVQASLYPFDPRVKRWFDPAQDPFTDPQYASQNLGPCQRRFIRIQHTFDLALDEFILQRGLKTTEYSASRKRYNNNYSLAGALKVDGKLCRGRYCIVLDKDNLIYHRYFELQKRTAHPERKLDSERVFRNIDFPALAEAQKVKKERKRQFRKERSSSLTVTNCFIKSKDQENSISYYLYLDPTNS